MELVAILRPGEKYEYFDSIGKTTDTVQAIGPNDLNILKAFTVIENGTYTPEELGFNLPLCQQINVGLCNHYYAYDKIMYKPRSFWERLLRLPARVEGGSGIRTRKSIEYSCATLDASLGHVNPMDGEHPYQMCIRDGRYIFDKANTPSEIVLHEYAHIIAGCKHRHDLIWAQACLSLGIEARTGLKEYVIP